MKRATNRVEVKRGRRTYYVGTFKHSRVAKDVRREADALLEAGDKQGLADLMDRYSRNREDEGDSSAQVA